MEDYEVAGEMVQTLTGSSESPTKILAEWDVHLPTKVAAEILISVGTNYIAEYILSLTPQGSIFFANEPSLALRRGLLTNIIGKSIGTTFTTAELRQSKISLPISILPLPCRPSNNPRLR